ncbi:GNAT family N-acetyltransferase [Stutzerimonas kirkiae]|uniref:NTP pyrophosphohydrolase n=1 Tax=Stutzerimonas kirkiae TaxID=2211392 RepID=A0A4Q9REG3_9GAMM|nr:GNAT family N-acetyltransferase [Stutzerimonas kirkiae]TBU99980.1 NTP pyrophosphohydrolase [Stutzerimonas kirkiae]TBV05686.1 NTP pyrophosphohydrolase [Stutzerimonas kirkiae]TBV10571.1 NTP pyrophosphohydrolase [Stutzerimonas kirkiae]TBV17429.1 NTP pyrophosphohydrolase [Stutzerimonas kirkiae]
MHTLTFQHLPSQQHPLIARFYRNQKSSMRASKGAKYWVARRKEIVAACCLTPVADGYWLTSLLVAPDERNRGIASLLLQRLSSGIAAPIWLFCHPSLQPLYAKAGFTPCDEIPPPLAERLTRYRRNKSLIALCKAPAMKTLNIASACLLDDENRLLIVRKRATRLFMLPGGKAEAGETPLQTLIRELTEELGVQMQAKDFQPLGHFQAEAANEPGFQVCAEVFVAPLRVPVKALAELEETGWLNWRETSREDLAPLLKEKILPALRASLDES